MLSTFRFRWRAGFGLTLSVKLTLLSKFRHRMIYGRSHKYKHGEPQRNFLNSGIFWGRHLAPLSFTASKTFNCEPVGMLCDDLSGRITCQHTHTRFHRGPLRALTPITKPNNTPLHIHHSWIWLHIWFIYLFSDGTSLSLFSLVNNSIKMSTTALLYINIMCNKASGREQVCTGTMGRGRCVNTQPSQQPNTI